MTQDAYAKIALMPPKKLKDDSIIEAVCHVRFCASDVPEVIIGRLTDVDQWKKFIQTRLPVSNIPAPIRDHDENLRFEPLVQLGREDGARLIRVGGNVLSYHVVGRYCGWAELQPELEFVAAELFTKVHDLTVTRIGFRYINALTSDRHFVPSVYDLNLALQVAESNIQGEVNLNYLEQSSATHLTLTKIASPYFLQGTLPPNTTAVVDIDVFTPPDFKTSSLDQLFKWVDDAHDFEKESFFRLLPKEILAKVEDK